VQIAEKSTDLKTNERNESRSWSRRIDLAFDAPPAGHRFVTGSTKSFFSNRQERSAVSVQKVRILGDMFEPSLSVGQITVRNEVYPIHHEWYPGA
jgi:hypothetical protein